jgi:hypothetical protein
VRDALLSSLKLPGGKLCGISWDTSQPSCELGGRKVISSNMFVKKDQYLREISNSQFCLCPFGSVPSVGALVVDHRNDTWLCAVRDAWRTQRGA